MLLRKKQGGASVGPHKWEHDGDILDVPDELGAELLAIKGNDFEHVLERAVDAVKTEAEKIADDMEGKTPATPAAAVADPNAGSGTGASTGSPETAPSAPPAAPAEQPPAAPAAPAAAST